LWDVGSGRRLEKFTPPARGLSARFTDDDQAVLVWSEGRRLSLFDPATGAELVSGLVEPTPEYVSYDPACRRILIWDTDGEVVKYTQGRYFFNWFRPTGRCPSE
jgi:hypothetical protein